jgi:hypothetical protein
MTSNADNGSASQTPPDFRMVIASNPQGGGDVTRKTLLFFLLKWNIHLISPCSEFNSITLSN